MQKKVSINVQIIMLGKIYIIMHLVSLGGSPGNVSEEPVTQEKPKKLCSFSNLSITSPVTAHSPTLPSFYLRHSSFFNPSVASPMSQFVFKPFFRFSYVTGSSITSPGEPPMLNISFSLNLQISIKCENILSGLTEDPCSVSGSNYSCNLLVRKSIFM